MGRLTELYYEDYEVGDSWTTSGRTVTDADIRMFIGATDATHPAHIDAEYCSDHPFGRIAAQGSLVLSIAEGLVVQARVLPRTLKLAHYGYDRVRFIQPVHLQDTVHVRCLVTEMRPRNEEFGLVSFRWEVVNQAGVIVLVADDIQMVERRSEKK